MDNKQIGIRIKEQRKNLGLTLQQVADEVKVNKSTIQRYENGSIKEIKLPVIEAIAAALNTDPLWLIGKKDKTIKHSKEYENKTYLCNLHFRSVMNWSEDKLLDEYETIIIREHIYDLLGRYKALIEKLVYAQYYWKCNKESYVNFYKNLEKPLSEIEMKENYLKQELESEIENMINWIKVLPNWVSREEYTLLNSKTNDEKDDSLTPIAAHERKNVIVNEDDKKHDIDIMKDDKEW